MNLDTTNMNDAYSTTSALFAAFNALKAGQPEKDPLVQNTPRHARFVQAFHRYLRTRGGTAD